MKQRPFAFAGVDWLGTMGLLEPMAGLRFETEPAPRTSPATAHGDGDGSVQRYAAPSLEQARSGPQKKWPRAREVAR